jgi:hypothetical protein
MRSDVTWAPKQPSRWWFFPCTSAATMPPSVTNIVPGLTGTKKPRGRNSRTISRSDRPASARSRPVAASKDRMRSARVVPTISGLPGAGRHASP